jgi:ABC-type multidrug transport system fused ATPase/permease subunit
MSTAASPVAGASSRAKKAAPPKGDFRGLFPYLLRYKGGIAIGLIAVLLMGVVGNVIPLLTGIITDVLAGNPVPFEHAHAAEATGGARAALPGESTVAHYIPFYAPNSGRSLAIYCSFVVLCVVIKGLLSFSARWVLIGVSRDIEFDIRNDLLDRLLLMEPEFYVRNRTGELMSRATNDLNAVRMVLGPGIMYSATTLATMILAIVILVALSPSLTLWVLLPAPIVAVAVWFFGKTIHDLYEKIQAALATLTARVQENLSGVRVVRAYV